MRAETRNLNVSVEFMRIGSLKKLQGNVAPTKYQLTDEISFNPRKASMVTADLLYEEELEYSVSFRQVRRVERGDTPPPSRFETTGRIKFDGSHDMDGEAQLR